MPQDPLTAQLIPRTLGQVPQEIPLPEQNDRPQGMGDKMFGGGMDFLLSALGIRGQKPGDLATGLGSLTGAAVPFLPGLGPTKAGMTVLEGEAPSLLKQIFAKNPQAEAVYNRALSAQAPEALASHVASKAGKYSTNADLHDALLDLHISGRPRLMRTETGITIPIPNETHGAPATQGYSNVPMQNALEAPEVTKRLGNATGLTPADIIRIRTMNPSEAALHYPEVSKTVLYKIITQDAYGGIK